MKKVIVIGIDGASLDRIKPWMDSNKLPHLHRMQQQGVIGTLQSTIPPYSAPAWVSLVTGVQPGKHGIYDFFRTDSFSKQLVSTRYRKAPAIWNYLTDAHKRSIIVNVPGTYPPEPIQGVMISGLLTPSEESEFTYPRSLKKDLVDKKLGKFEFEQIAVDDVPKNLMARYNPQKFVESVNTATQSHTTVFTNLLKKEHWDFAMIVYRGTDDAQHLLWNNAEAILSCYQQVDEGIGALLESFPDALFIIVSDHGFCTSHKYLYVNNLLYNAGYVQTYTDPCHTRDAFFLKMFNRFSRLLFHCIPLKKLVRTPLGRKLILSAGGNRNINFEKTTAWYHSVCSQGIRIHRKDKYEQGSVDPQQYDTIREEIIRLLQSVTDPDTKKSIVKQVYRWEEVYGKNAVNDPLDIIFELHQGYGAQEIIGVPDKATHVPCSKTGKPQLPVLVSPGFYDWIGDHASQGILAMYGEGVKPNHQTAASVTDIVPTILASLDLSVPESLDGSVVSDAFINPPIITKRRWEPQASDKQLLSDAELKKIRELRLK